MTECISENTLMALRILSALGIGFIYACLHLAFRYGHEWINQNAFAEYDDYNDRAG